MSDDHSSSIIRMIRVSGVACAVVAASVVYCSNEPKLSALSTRLEETSSVLRSDDIVLSTTEHVRERRDLLKRRYARMLRRDVEATFLQELDRNVRRHSTTSISTTVQGHDSTGNVDDVNTGLRRVDFTIELRGTYRNLLATIAQLSAGDQIVDVRSVSLRRADSSLIARVPLTLFETDGPR